MLICCTIATTAFAEDNKTNVTYTLDNSLISGLNKKDIRVIDYNFSERVDTVYTVYFDGGSVTGAPGTSVLVLKDGVPTYKAIESLQEGDAIYVDDKVTGSVVTKEVDDVEQGYKKQVVVTGKSTRSGFKIGPEAGGNYSWDQAQTQGFSGFVALVLGVDYKWFAIYGSLGMGIERYGNLSQKSNMKYYSPFVGIECLAKYYAFGDDEEHNLYSGIGFRTSYSKYYFEDEFSWVSGTGWRLSPYVVPIGYSWQAVGKVTSIHLDSYVSYFTRKGDHNAQAHGVEAGLRFWLTFQTGKKVK